MVSTVFDVSIQSYGKVIGKGKRQVALIAVESCRERTGGVVLHLLYNAVLNFQMSVTGQSDAVTSGTAVRASWW